MNALTYRQHTLHVTKTSEERDEKLRTYRIRGQSQLNLLLLDMKLDHTRPLPHVLRY